MDMAPIRSTDTVVKCGEGMCRYATPVVSSRNSRMRSDWRFRGPVVSPDRDGRMYGDRKNPFNVLPLAKGVSTTVFQHYEGRKS